MPAELLTGAGFFGKMPATGDFVARGIAPGVRRKLDEWIGVEVLPVLGPAGWPDGGLRFLTAGQKMAGLTLPSRDRVGRTYPLTIVVPLDSGCGPDACEPWADAVHHVAAAALEGDLEPDGLTTRIALVPPPQPNGVSVDGPLFWFRGGPAVSSVADAYESMNA